MDINRLYSLHQLALIRAAEAEDHDEREQYIAEADHIASRVSDFQERVGADSTNLLPANAF